MLNKVLMYIKSLYFNLKVFPIDIALKLPILLDWNVKLGELNKGCIQIEDEIYRGMIKLGWNIGSKGVFNGDYPRKAGGGYISVENGCKIIFHKNTTIANGFSIRLDKNGEIIFGKNFAANYHSFFATNARIKIGDDCALGWNVTIRDVDGHPVYLLDDPTQTPFNEPKEINIGDHVWIAAEVTILKGSVIPPECVVAYGSMVTGKKFDKTHCIIGGNPGKVLKEEIGWRL